MKISGIETRKSIENINKNKNWFIDKINNTDKSLNRLAKKKERLKLVKSRMKIRTSLATLKKEKGLQMNTMDIYQQI